MTKITVKEGTKFFTSVVGHYNFQYPSTTLMAFRSDVTCQVLPWMGPEDLIPVHVQDSSALPRSCKSEVVWIQRSGK